jgi:protein AbiQ
MNKITADYSAIVSEFTVYLNGFKKALRKNRVSREALFRESSLINFSSVLTN